MNIGIGMCVCCSDNHKFDNMVLDANNIRNHIVNINQSFSGYNRNNSYMNDYRKLYMNMKSDCKHPHFMCGACFKVNKSRLTNAENDMMCSIVNFIGLYKDEKDKDKAKSKKYAVLRLLQGHYPIIYKIVERI